MSGGKIQAEVSVLTKTYLKKMRLRKLFRIFSDSIEGFIYPSDGRFTRWHGGRKENERAQTSNVKLSDSPIKPNGVCVIFS